jgi:hypothetical protein
MKQTLALLNNPINKQETHVSDVDSIENTECLQQTFKNLLSFKDKMLLDKNHVFNLFVLILSSTNSASVHN